MKRFLPALGALWALLSPALAVDPATTVGNAAYTILSTDVRIFTTTPFTAGRTWTLPPAAATCIGQSCTPPQDTLEIIDTAGAISQAFPLTIAPASGETINGNAANLILSAAGVRTVLYPTSAGNWQSFTVGDYLTTGPCLSSAATATITVTIAAPGVITWTAHGMTGACPVVFTTSGALPTGITAGTTYWIVPSSVTTDTFQIATTVANALAGTSITTTGTQSGTQTGTAGQPLATTTAANVTGLSLSQGDWDCRSNVSRVMGGATSVTVLSHSHSTTSATMATQGTLSTDKRQTAANVMGATGQDTKVSADRIKVAATTNVFVVAQDTFTVSTNNAYGSMTCRRLY